MTGKLNNRPDPLAPFEEKLTNEYGLKIAKLISGEWFNGGIISPGCAFMKRRNYVRNKRLFVRGKSDNEYYKNTIEKGDNDLDYINLDWTQINWAEKFSRIVSNSIHSDNYKVKVNSIDGLSEIQRRSKEDFYRKAISTRQLSNSFKEMLGLDMSPSIEIPDTEEDVPLFMELNERPKIEISEEMLIDFVKKSNDFQILEEQRNKDLVDVGIICARIYIDKNDGVKIDYVDPENYIHSRVKTLDFSDKYYDGYVERITLSDLRRESGFDDARLLRIAKVYGLLNAVSSVGVVYDKNNIDDLLDYTIDVLRFSFKTSKTIKYKTKKKNGRTVRATKRDDQFSGSGKDFGELSKTLDTWLEGNYVIGTEEIYAYGESENLYDDVMNKSVSPFVVFAYDLYNNELRSFTDNIEAPARQLQKIHLKIQHLISELKPDLIEIDLDQLAELDDGKGGTKKEVWEMALTIMQTKGVVFKKRINMGDDGIKDQAAIRPFATQQGGALVPLFNAWAHYYNLIRDNTGINPAADGSMPGYSLIGTNQMAQMASNTVTRSIVETALMFNKRVAEVVSSRILTIFSYEEGSELRKIYENVVSKELVDAASILKDRHLHEFGFVIEMKPSNEELEEFNESLTLSLQDGSIDVEVVVRAREIAKSNIKMAMQYLVYERKKRMRKAQEEQMMLAQNKSENDAMAAQARIKAEAEAYQNKKQVDLWFEREKAEIDILKQKALIDAKNSTREADFNEKVYLKQLEQMGLQDKEKYREDRKDKRTEKQASQQSQLIEQRKGNAPAMSFENEMGF